MSDYITCDDRMNGTSFIFSSFPSSFSPAEGANGTVPLQDSPSAAYIALLIVSRYCTPILAALGLIGNTLTYVVLLHSQMKVLPSSIFVAAVSATDSLFLLGLLLMWTKELGWNIYGSEGWCQLLSLVTLSSNFLSTWYTVGLAAERYTAVLGRSTANSVLLRVFVQSSIGGNRATVRLNDKQRPFCTTLIARIYVITLCVVAISVYVNIVISIGVVEHGDRLLCLPLPVSFTAMRMLTRLDLLVNVLLPYMGVTIMYALLYVRITMRHIRRRHAICRSAEKLLVARLCSRKEVKLTKMAALLTLTTVLFGLPSHVMRTVYSLREMIGFPLPEREADFWGQEVTQLLFYAGFSTTFYVMICSYSTFRKATKLLIIGDK